MAKPMILVVDDDRPVADSISNVIKDLKEYDVLTAYSAKEALKQLAKNKVFLGLGGNRIRLIFLDIKMPDMDGLQLLEKIRRDYGEDIGISMLTAWEDAEKWERATNGYVVNYLRKPLDREQLAETIKNYFAGKEVKMTIETFERHIEKMEEFKRAAESEAKK